MIDAPAYPLPLGARLRGDWFPLYPDRLLGSRFAATVDPAAGFYAILLWARSAQQDPAGTLPRDDVELAFLAGLGRDLNAWRAVREGALYGWEDVLCLPEDGDPAEGVVRFGHPVIAEVMTDTLRRMSEARDESRRGAERALRSRLKRIMREKCGAHAGLTERDAYVSAVLAKLRERDLRWTADNVQRAMDAVSLEMDGADGSASGIVAGVASRLRPGAARGP